MGPKTLVSRCSTRSSSTSPRTPACLRLLVVSVLAAASIFVAEPAKANDTSYFVALVDFTPDGGATLLYEPSPDTGIDGLFQPNGTPFSAECWSSGSPVTNVNGYTSDIYLRATGSVYLPEAFAYTAGYGVPPGLVNCDIKDHLLDRSVGAPYLYHEAGLPYVGYVDKIYVSKAETAAAYESMRELTEVSGRIACNAIGVAIGVIAGSYATPAGGLVAYTTFQTMLGDIMCNTAAGMSSSADVEARLQDIVDDGGCAVLSGWTEGIDMWVTSDISSTDDPFFCA